MGTHTVTLVTKIRIFEKDWKGWVSLWGN